MSDEELRDQINKIAVEIEEIEQTAKQKDSYVKKRINEEYDPEMSKIESQLQKEQAIFDEIIKSIDELVVNKKEMIPIIKNLEKKYNSLKRDKEKAFNAQLKAIVKERKAKTKIINREIKILEKKLKSDKNK